MRVLSESDMRLRHIDPALIRAEWKTEQIFTEYYFTDGQVLVQNNIVKRGQGKKCDYLLTAANLITPLAIVEAKKGYKSVGDGLQQAIDYASILDVPFAYSSNGYGFVERDLLTGKETNLTMDEFPTPEQLWQRYANAKKLSPIQEQVIKQPYYFDRFKNIKPRYYQRIAIDRTVQAVAKGQDRILLVMATGTGKTYTAFQIIWRLMQTGIKKKILFLADRNILIDQTMQNDFKPFEKIITKVQGKDLDSSYEIYMSLYQQLAGEEGEEPFRQFKPEFFDLIIVDECHRGSAKEESLWRRVLDYFSTATHLGLTATPTETKEASSTYYFGEPIYTYSLKQGIQDGFLAPYKVMRVLLNKDLEGWRPEAGTRDIEGKLVEDREYNIKDFDRNIVLNEREITVAKRITRWLKDNDRYAKTIIFCVDIEHAERMRQAMVNENTDIVKDHPKYVMRITGDNKEGKDQLDNFIDVNETFPTIVTTSKLMTTGVDCKTCKLIVLDSNIGSMTEFKQIIGRGTRLNEKHGKLFFTIMDFRNVTKLFADPNFDGEPVQIIEVPPNSGDDKGEDEGEKGEGQPPNDEPTGGTTGEPPIFDPPQPPPPRKVYVKGVPIEISKEHVQFYDANGKLVTESLKDYSRRNILQEYASLDDFIHAWQDADKKQAIIDELENNGVFFEVLEDLAGRHDLDPFDLILHIAYDKPPLSRAERANQVKKRGYLHQYDETCQKVLNALLDKYKDEGIKPFEDMIVLKTKPFDSIGTQVQIVKEFGGKLGYKQAIKQLQAMLYGFDSAA